MEKQSQVIRADLKPIHSAAKMKATANAIDQFLRNGFGISSENQRSKIQPGGGATVPGTPTSSGPVQRGPWTTSRTHTGGESPVPELATQKDVPGNTGGTGRPGSESSLSSTQTIEPSIKPPIDSTANAVIPGISPIRMVPLGRRTS